MLDPERAKEIWPEIFDVLQKAEEGRNRYVQQIAEKYGMGNNIMLQNSGLSMRSDQRYPHMYHYLSQRC
jgi:hypothetical protein